MDIYEQFREILDTHPSGAPKSETFNKILRILFTSEEMEVAIHMSFKPMGIEDIAKASSVSIDETGNRLESMAEKGIIFSREKEGKKSYFICSTIPGLFEHPFMKGGGTPAHEKLGKLWEEYYHEGMGESLCGKPTPMARVVPVEKSLSSKTVVHPYEEVSNLIENTNYLAVTNCACRVSVGKCDAPLDVCLIFGSWGKFLVERGHAREISKEEAVKVLDRTEEAGLVHTSNNSADRAPYICSCCPCCCVVLRGITQLNNHHAIAVSEYIAMVNADECTGCGICSEERCPMDAIELQNDIAVVTERCIGCGLCVTGCPSDAIELVKRERAPMIPNTVQEMGLKIVEEKNKMESFIKIMQR